MNNANEIAHYEYGATLAGEGILNTLDAVEIGKTEIELARNLAKYGQPNSTTTICSTGKRFTKAVIYPRDQKVAFKDRFSASVGYKGGFSIV